jgi:hypothetical protein
LNHREPSAAFSPKQKQKEIQPRMTRISADVRFWPFPCFIRVYPRDPRQPFFVLSKIFAARENLNG